MHKVPKYIVIEKQVGETPLVALERARKEYGLASDIPLTYAGRLDPMASGALVILIGDECKKQSAYHTFDKEYAVELLFGISSDTGDVLGVVSKKLSTPTSEDMCRTALATLRGPITLPYPHFSSKTVQGKPLHTWTLENRLGEIEIPTKQSQIYRLSFNNLRTIARDEILKTVRTKIETIPPVTDPQKILGADFRRDQVRASWDAIAKDDPVSYQILTFTCTASSGTYMRSLCEHIATELGTTGLAYSIHRTIIGNYLPLIGNIGFWIKHLR